MYYSYMEIIVVHKFFNTVLPMCITEQSTSVQKTGMASLKKYHDNDLGLGDHRLLFLPFAL